MNEQIGDERVIPSGWPGQRGGGSGRLGMGRGLLLCGGVVSHGVDAGEAVAAEGGEEGDGAGAAASRRSPKTVILNDRVPEAPTLPTNRARGRRDEIAGSSTERGTVDDG